MQNKNIIRFCFVGIFFIVIANIIVYRQLIVEKVILGKVSSSNKVLISTYMRYLSHISPIVTEDYQINRDATLTQKDRDSLYKHTKKFFGDASFLKVEIYNTIGELIFSSSDIEIVLSRKQHNDIAPLLDYLAFTDLVGDKRLLLNILLKDKDKEYKASTVAFDIMDLPTNDGKSFKVHIYRDISEIWYAMSYIEFKIFLTILCFFIAMFIVIIYNTRIAQKIINKQNQDKRVLKIAKDKAENESSSKSQFLANVSHELRTPLNSIIGFSEIILAEKEKSQRSKVDMSYIHAIHDSGKHLLGIINDILDYSKIIAEQLPIDMIDLNINKIATYAIRLIEPRADKGKITLIKDFPDEPPIVKADSKRLRQALLNVLSNAVKFTNENGTVTIKIERSKNKNKVYIKIIDTGIGIAKENMGKALSSFQQIDDMKTRHYDGTGLGLPLTKKLIELMGAGFAIKSEVGKGTIVQFTFKAINIFPKKKKA